MSRFGLALPLLASYLWRTQHMSNKVTERLKATILKQENYKCISLIKIENNLHEKISLASILTTSIL